MKAYDKAVSLDRKTVDETLLTNLGTYYYNPKLQPAAASTCRKLASTCRAWSSKPPATGSTFAGWPAPCSGTDACVVTMDQARTLAVTFTARAASEMRSRLRDLEAPGVQARTFHAAALRQLQFFWPQAIGGQLPNIIDHKAHLVAEAARRLRITTDRASIRDLAAEIEWAKVSMHTPEGYAEAARGRTAPAGLDHTTVARLFQSYEDVKTDRHVIDFEDVLLLTVAVLEEDQRVAATVREQYRHFVVDEYQDVSPLQQRLLDAWLGGRDDVCVVGDASQTIYSFTGATSRHLLEFPARHPQARVVELVRDYRSTPQVVETANRLLAAGGDAVCVCDFQDALALKQPTVSYHLKQLVDAGLRSSAEGRRVELSSVAVAGSHSSDLGIQVARALVGQPSILLADEPTGNLDSKNGEAVMSLLDELHRGGATICVVTHDPRYAQHAEKSIHLFDGRVVEETVAPV